MSSVKNGECMALPLVRLSEIPLEGLEVSCQAQACDLNLDPVDATVEGEFDLHADILAIEPVYQVQGELSGVIRRNCVRCLEDYEDSESFPFSVQYREKDSTVVDLSTKTKNGESLADKDEAELSDSDGFLYEGDVINLAPMLRELVILGNPIQALCRQDCRGLCPTCGINKNFLSCLCQEERLPNPFAVLQQFRKGQQGASPKETSSSKSTRHEPTND